VIFALVEPPPLAPWIAALPAVNATLNGLTTLLLTAGFICIKNGNKIAHAACMISSLVMSTLFLTCYLLYHAFAGVTKFTTPGLPKVIYYFILATHVPLAVLILPFIFAAVYFAARRKFETHKKITRWLWPVWMYVSVTGVIIYVMLYHLYPGVRLPL
jgi:putative membrane protein